MEDTRHTPASANDAHVHDHPEHPGAVNQTNDDHTRQPANLSSAAEARRPSSGPQTLQANSKFTSMYKRRRSRLVITDPAQIFPIPPADFNEIIERKDLPKISELGGANGIMHALRTNEVDGITTDEVEIAARVERYTRNELPAADPVSFWKLFFTALKDKTMIMLIIAAVVSIILGMTLEDPHTGRVEREIGWIEGVAILFSVMLVVLVSSVSDYQKAKKFEELDKETAKRSVMCIRNGHREQLDASELLVGDLIEFEYGQQLAVDAIYLRGSEVKCDESAATGESDYIKKNSDKDPFLISGTNVVEGSGRAVVVGVGIHSFNGKLTMATRGGGNAETPLQIKLGKMADYIGRGGAIAAILVLVALVIRNAIVVATNGREYNVNALVGYIIVSITVVVVAVPEGLPLAVTIALAYSMKAMLADNCLVRVLRSCETMGGCTSICSDKTGTLTTNEMTVVQGWVAEEQFVIAGYGIEPLEGMTNPLSTSARNLKPQEGPQQTVQTRQQTNFEAESKAGQPRGKIQLKTSSNLMEIICKSLSINSTADERPNNEGKMVWVGNKTEQGLLGFVKRFYDYKEFRKAIQDEDRHAYPFSSTKKRMVTIVHNAGSYTVHIKGASEIVLADSTHYLSPSGERKPMTADKRAQIERAIMYMADQGNRTIAVATAESKGAPLPNSELRPGGMAYPEEEPNDVKELCLVAIMGIQDPIRSEVPDAVKKCQGAGITVRMVTGDNINTAKAIAKKCGIYNEDKGIALEGREFRQIAKEDPARLNEILPRLQVVARSSPTDKHILVKALMELGEIVAVTGDGTNDAPALTTADVGFAMRTGTEVAKGAADMVLMDDNFASVVGATRWGRTVNDNVRKFLQFQLTINVVGVLLTFIGSAMSDEGESPLKPVQLLWLNLVMDTLAALCLATEMPTWESLERPPVLRSAPLISHNMWCFIIGHSIFQLAVVIVLMVCGHVWFEVGPCLSEDSPHYDASGKHCKMGKIHCTVIFNAFILMQLVNQWNARKLYGELNPFTGLARNKLMVYLFPVTLGFQVFAVECEPVMREAMQTYPLNWNQWVGCCVIAIVVLPVGLLIKLITRYIPEWRPKPVVKEEENADPVIRVRVEGSNQNTAAEEPRS